MTTLLRATVASLTGGLVLAGLGCLAPAHAGQTDAGALDLSRAEGSHATCGKAARDLITHSNRDYYMRSVAFLRIQRSRMLAKNVSTTSTLPNGSSVVSTDVVRCVGQAVRKGSRRPTTVFYAITYAPDIVDWMLSGRADSTPPPPPTYSVTYSTGSTPGW